MKRVYYDHENNKIVEDVSFVKTVDQIKLEYGINECQILDVDEIQEDYRVRDGVLVKVTRQEIQAEIDAARNEQLEEARSKAEGLRIKLGLSADEFKTLTEVVRSGC